jgi:spartin
MYTTLVVTAFVLPSDALKWCLTSRVVQLLLSLAGGSDDASSSFLSSPLRMASSFALLTLPDVLLSTSAGTERGPLVVECVTLDGRAERDVVLVLRVRALEAVVDPRRHITLAAGDGDPRVYTFHALADDPSELVLTLPAVIPEKASEVTVDVDTLDAVLEQYADFTPHGAHLEPSADHRTFQLVDDGDDEDLRGRLVLIDETNGAVLGAVGERDTIRPDPVLGARGHEQDAVVIDVGADDELGARTRFAKAIPPGEHDAITKTASILR